MNKSCFFTGHRVLKIDDELFTILKSTLKSLIERGVTDFYAGGALEFDMVCANYVLRFKEDMFDIRLHMVLPCDLEIMCEKWGMAERGENKRICRYADSVEQVSQEYYDGCMKKRNARLAELGDICVCYWDGRKRGGTFQTVNMAKKKGIEIINLFDLLKYKE